VTHTQYLTLSTFADTEAQQGGEKALLRQALKLLILIHIGGDTFIAPTPSSRAIIANFFGPGIDDANVTPCFIRGQLGPVFTELALDKMREVLRGLEFHCLSRKCQHFPLVIAAFAIVFMAVESIQYHSAKDPYHANHDTRSVGGRGGSVFDSHVTNPALTEEDSSSIDALLHFYKACFSGCHRDRLLSVSRGTGDAADSGSSADGGSESTSPTVGVAEGSASGTIFVARLKDAVERVKIYLYERSRAPVSTNATAKGGDITVFFDRLLAKLFLLDL
jgi:hypothetical protein